MTLMLWVGSVLSIPLFLYIGSLLDDHGKLILIILCSMFLAMLPVGVTIMVMLFVVTDYIVAVFPYPYA